MHKQVKKYLSFFFLFLLLFPIAEVGLHASEHQKDLHCTATEKHFHPLEHSCSICDFTITDSNSLPDTKVQFDLPSQDFTFLTLTESVTLTFLFSNLPARAPPTA